MEEWQVTPFFQVFVSHINSGCAGMTSEDTAVPFPYRDQLRKKRHCRFLRLDHSDEERI